MAENHYDAIVIGARCAGSPTAMLLARHGHRILVVDRATFPSDTISTHLVHPPGVAALQRWGLLDRVVATGCPPIDTYAFDFGPFTIAGAPGTADSPVAYGPRRTVLDKLLVDAAAEAGAEARERFTAFGLVVDDGRVTGIRGHTKGGATVTERARVVIGADGLHSLVARAVRPEQYYDKPQLLCGYYTYWSGLPMHGRFEAYIRPHRAFAAWPTNDDLTLVIGGWPFAEFEANKRDIEGNYLAMFELAPDFADRIRSSYPRGALRRHRGAELLPQALRPRLGAGGRRWLPQRLHHVAGHPRRLPGRRAVRHRRSTRPSPVPDPSRRRWAGIRPPATSTSCRSTSSPPSSPPSSPLHPTSSNSSAPCTVSGTRWTGSRGSTPE
jgi:2-polyprenyl-6-methoxyphenol hydroxylase-like FAD-dependent oxidoreductase